MRQAVVSAPPEGDERRATIADHENHLSANHVSSPPLTLSFRRYLSVRNVCYHTADGGGRIEAGPGSPNKGAPGGSTASGGAS